MNSLARLLIVSISLTLLSGCVATVPLKVASKTTKLGVKTATTGVKTTAKVAGAVIPEGEEENASK